MVEKLQELMLVLVEVSDLRDKFLACPQSGKSSSRLRVWMLPQTKNLVFKWRRVERCIHYSPSSEPRVALALGDLSVMKKKEV